jgi:three-Cys-motif partner protein
MPRKALLPGPDDPALFELTPMTAPVKVAKIETAIWTEHKATFIARYLYYFVFITHHGTYIDGFAGPQSHAPSNMWAAKLVLESEPRWLRHFHLFDSHRGKIQQLRAMVRAQEPRQPGEPTRSVSIRRGDFNRLVRDLFRRSPIKEREATFCLLDQRTFECRWDSVEAIASHKKAGYKIELFYFLANLWLDRALSAAQRTKTRRQIEEWWGRPDWEQLRALTQPDRAQLFGERLKQLGYAHVMPYPIFEKKGGRGHIMYYMIHATDHPEAPKIMRRAYDNAVTPPEPADQLKMELGALSED